MSKLTDKELLEELQHRFSENKRSVEELSALTKQLQALNDKLKESEKIKSLFLANIRNELNDPLTSILGLSKNIQSPGNDQWEKTRAMAALIHAEAFDLDFQLRNIFAAAELESGELVLEVVQVDVYTLVRNVVDMYAHQLQAKQLEVKYLDNADSAVKRLFKTDPAKLQLIVSNLLANAIEFSYPQNEITITASIEKNTLHLLVKDSGIGMKAAEQELIFAPFTQLDKGSVKLHKGHGLGLSIIKGILEVLSGQMELTSSTGKGSIFTVCIPESVTEADHFASGGNEWFFTEGEWFLRTNTWK